ncbi:hypothetical protein B0H14DRAFT_2620969 [Mycena olivaceomarginata]|nr:hypothetical protein B0H14DRAFT_2620969 [Mycena olivaceomarginata]
MQRLLPTEEDVSPVLQHVLFFASPWIIAGCRSNKIDLEEEDSLTLADQIDALINEAVQDFPDKDDIDSAAKYAAEIARAVIKDKNPRRASSVKAFKNYFVTHYIAFHMRKNPEWEAMKVKITTPSDITAFIIHKCGEKAKGCEGKKYATAVSTRAALTYWYRTIRPNESDMHNLYDYCFKPNASPAQMRWGIVRYTAYLFAWLLLLRFEEVLSTRKSAQTGVGHAWTLHANDLDPKICPVRALIRLAVVYGETTPLTGPLFLRINKHGAIQDQITTGVMSRTLTTDLQELGYKSWAMYGTHSFRRGGCQHRIKNKGWTVDMVAAWGGWSQVEAITMFRYFYSPKDNHEFMADYDRNDPKRQRVVLICSSTSFPTNTFLCRLPSKFPICSVPPISAPNDWILVTMGYSLNDKAEWSEFLSWLSGFTLPAGCNIWHSEKSEELPFVTSKFPFEFLSNALPTSDSSLDVCPHRVCGTSSLGPSARFKASTKIPPAERIAESDPAGAKETEGIGREGEGMGSAEEIFVGVGDRDEWEERAVI